MTAPPTPAQLQIAKCILALRKLTAQNGMITKLTQNKILEKLSPEDLAVVAEILADPGQLSSVQGGS